MQLAQYIEHTAVAPNVTPESIERLCCDAVEHSLFGVCVSSVFVSLAEQCLRGSPVRIVSIAGFPFGACKPAIKAEEAAEAVSDGAHEVDMVMAIGLALGGGWNAVAADVRAVRSAIGNATLKVILETGYLDADQMRQAALVATDEGADFVKTSSGYGPRGVTVGDVELLYGFLAGRAEIKASGGIRTAEAARRLVEAGATRIGTSRGVDLVALREAL